MSQPATGGDRLRCPDSFFPGAAMAKVIEFPEDEIDVLAFLFFLDGCIY